MIGSVRDKDDERIVQQLRDQAIKLKIQDKVSFEINLPRDDLLAIF